MNEAASLSSYRNGGAARRGSISITDSTGFEFSVEIPEAARTVGDVIKRINDASSGRVTAQLNRTGDGFELVDQAGGAGQLQVKELGGTTAADLRLLGTGTAGGDGKSFINSRAAVVIQLESTDTLAGLATKINSAGGGVTASVTDDGSSLTPKRLLLSSSVSGAAGNLIIDDGGLGLGLIERSSGQDALLRSGTGRDGISSFLRTSASNHFDNVAPGLAVDAVTVGTAPANVSVVQDTGVITDSVKSFVNGYNDLLSRIATLTKFDSTTGDRGALQGNGTVLRLRSALSDIITSRAFGGADNPLRSLQSLGVTMGTDGKLSVDSFKLSIAVLTNPSGTKKFFSDTSNGFAAKLKSTLDSYTDSISGKLTAATTNLKTSVDSTQQRIESLTVLLQQRQTTLLNKFYSMEVALSKLNAQQSALSKLQNLSSSSSSSG